MKDPLVIIVVAVLIFIVYQMLTKNNKRLTKFRKEWETGKFISLSEDFYTISSYWSNKKRNAVNYDGIDQLTSDDLALDEVYKKINYTQSTVGSEYLFNQIRDIHPAPENVQVKENLYNTLSKNDSLREKILLILAGLGKRNQTNSSTLFYPENDWKIDHAYRYILLGLLPIASIALMFVTLKYGLICFSLSFFTNILIYYRNKSKLENDLQTITYVAAVVQTGKRFASVTHPEFIKHADEFKEHVKPIKKVSFLSMLVSTGAGGEFDFIIEYVRILFMVDFIAYNKIVQTITENRDAYRNVWEHIGKLDAAVAVAFYRKSLDTYCIPEFIDNEELSFENMAHPLLDNPVTNTSTLDKSTLVTGSNASGKSTYIKAIAINAILAQTIHTALAEKWSMKPSYIVTSMAIQDNVLDGDSYFIAEIKSLKRIIRVIEEGKPCISFVDEILKGTNTVERIAASAAMMAWLSTNKGMSIVASHDIELTEMTRPAYTNVHFRESIENGQVLFDYTVHSGPAKTRNAIKLLEILEYPEEITVQANELAHRFTEQRKWGALEEMK